MLCFAHLECTEAKAGTDTNPDDNNNVNDNMEDCDSDANTEPGLDPNFDADEAEPGTEIIFFCLAGHSVN